MTYSLKSTLIAVGLFVIVPGSFIICLILAASYLTNLGMLWVNGANSGLDIDWNE